MEKVLSLFHSLLDAVKQAKIHLARVAKYVSYNGIMIEVSFKWDNDYKHNRHDKSLKAQRKSTFVTCTLQPE